VGWVLVREKGLLLCCGIEKETASSIFPKAVKLGKMVHRKEARICVKKVRVEGGGEKTWRKKETKLRGLTQNKGGH